MERGRSTGSSGPQVIQEDFLSKLLERKSETMIEATQIVLNTSESEFLLIYNSSEVSGRRCRDCGQVDRN